MGHFEPDRRIPRLVLAEQTTAVESEKAERIERRGASGDRQKAKKGAVLQPPVSYISKHMDINKILGELKAERDQIEMAILSLERLLAGRGKRRGRPPAWLSQIKAVGPRRRGRPPGSGTKKAK